jgi:hypothetical protein
MPRAHVVSIQGPDDSAMAFFDKDGTLSFATATAGTYQAKRSDGAMQVWTAQIDRQPLSLDKSTWQVHFKPSYVGKPFEVPFKALTDWAKHEDEKVRYFSGTAVYSTRFTWSNAIKNARVKLNLGKVCVIAAVKVNGVDCGVLWKEPFTADITTALREGENHVEVSVANTWHNRLIGDEQYPDDTGALPNGLLKGWPEWMVKNQPRPEANRTTLVTNKQKEANKKTPLHV